ncbi:hypothetical protein M1N77_05250 [Thermodesulfovibrionales bacterium]|nr:hypothetical protein [Thermodesulfovibrionales bacterium]
MERTESRIVQVAPTHENGMIEEMQRFGWNLQGRQEMRVEGDTAPDLATSLGLSGNTQTHITKIQHYVKLHFVRSLELPNLERIRRIESEYFDLPFPPDSGPEFKKLLLSSAWKEFVAFFAGVALVIAGAITHFILLFLGIFLIGWGIYRGDQREREIKRSLKETREQSSKIAQELLTELKSLGCG